LIRVEGLSVRVGDVPILSDISLSLRPGQVLGVIGESGAGKTTLARTLVRLGPGRVEGRILLGEDQENVLAFDARRLRRYRGRQVALVVQAVGDALNPHMRVLEQVMDAIPSDAGLSRTAIRQRALALLERQGLHADLAERFPRGLSGGEIQRILLAMALANDPGVLILDEPTSALDPEARQTALDVIAEAARNRAVLLITHDVEAVRTLSDDLAVLYGGQVIEEGPASVLLNRPAHPYTRALLRAQPDRLSGKDLQGVPGRFERPATGCAFANRCVQRVAVCLSDTPALDRPVDAGPDHRVACHRGGIVAALTARNLHKAQAGQSVLTGLDLEVMTGETVAVCGASGSGKSTLAHLLCGLEPPDAGTIALDDREGEGAGGVALVAQHPHLALAPHFTVVEAVVEPLLFRASHTEETRRARALECLHVTQLPTDDTFLARKVHALSGGELQRLALARALVGAPSVLVADEATSALDVSVQAKVLRLLSDLQEHHGLAIVLITHDLAVARRAADRLLRLDQGRLTPV